MNNTANTSYYVVLDCGIVVDGASLEALSMDLADMGYNGNKLVATTSTGKKVGLVDAEDWRDY